MEYPDAQMFASGVYDLKRNALISHSSRRVESAASRSARSAERDRCRWRCRRDGSQRRVGWIRTSQAIVDTDGRVVERIDPKERERVMSAKSAGQLTQMMSDVVREGTGTAAALEGIEVAGKTGTAELNIARRINQPWFIGFAPRSAPKVAIAVTLENVIEAMGKWADRWVGPCPVEAQRRLARASRPRRSQRSATRRSATR